MITGLFQSKTLFTAWVTSVPDSTPIKLINQSAVRCWFGLGLIWFLRHGSTPAFEFSSALHCNGDDNELSISLSSHRTKESFCTSVHGFFANCQFSSQTPKISSTYFWHPNAKNTKNTNTGTPWKLVLFQKTWLKRVKGYSFNLYSERAIVEDCVVVILPPQLTL